MRTSLLASGALMLLALVPAGAQARIASTPIKPAFQTNRLGAGTTATFHVDINTEDNANVLPSPGTHARVRLPKGIVINPKPFLRYAKGCTKANIQLDRKALSEIAIADPAAFDAIVALAKAAIAA